MLNSYAECSGLIVLVFVTVPDFTTLDFEEVVDGFLSSDLLVDPWWWLLLPFAPIVVVVVFFGLLDEPLLMLLEMLSSFLGTGTFFFPEDELEATALLWLLPPPALLADCDRFGLSVVDVTFLVVDPLTFLSDLEDLVDDARDEMEDAEAARRLRPLLALQLRDRMVGPLGDAEGGLVMELITVMHTLRCSAI